MASVRYHESVFINVPFDKKYKRIFDAIVFSVFDCGFVARSSLEIIDSTETRIKNLFNLIAESKYGIHDISRTSLDKQHRLPRFNMPLELGIFLGAKIYGCSKHRLKTGLILDCDKYRYMKFCSDISGQDIRSHNNDPSQAVCIVRDWLNSSPDIKDRIILPSGKHIYEHYCAFLTDLPDLCADYNLDKSNLLFNNYTTLVSGWLKARVKIETKGSWYQPI